MQVTKREGKSDLGRHGLETILLFLGERHEICQLAGGGGGGGLHLYRFMSGAVLSTNTVVSSDATEAARSPATISAL